MKDVQRLLSIMSDGLKTLAQGVEALAKKVDNIAKTHADVKPAKKKPATDAAKSSASKESAPKPASKKKVKPMTAVETVFNVISKSKNGVNTATIMEETGYNRKQIANHILKLKRQGKVKSVKRGVYMKT